VLWSGGPRANGAYNTTFFASCATLDGRLVFKTRIRPRTFWFANHGFPAPAPIGWIGNGQAWAELVAHDFNADSYEELRIHPLAPAKRPFTIALLPDHPFSVEDEFRFTGDRLIVTRGGFFAPGLDRATVDEYRLGRSLQWMKTARLTPTPQNLDGAGNFRSPELSPSGNYGCWQPSLIEPALPGQTPKDRYLMQNGHPLMRALFIARTSDGHLQEMGLLPLADPLLPAESIDFSPDDKLLSFIYNGYLYTVPNNL
jgi:hypothetical protein